MEMVVWWVGWLRDDLERTNSRAHWLTERASERAERWEMFLFPSNHFLNEIWNCCTYMPHRSATNFFVHDPCAKSLFWFSLPLWTLFYAPYVRTYLTTRWWQQNWQRRPTDRPTTLRRIILLLGESIITTRLSLPSFLPSFLLSFKKPF